MKSRKKKSKKNKNVVQENFSKKCEKQKLQCDNALFKNLTPEDLLDENIFNSNNVEKNINSLDSRIVTPYNFNNDDDYTIFKSFYNDKEENFTLKSLNETTTSINTLNSLNNGYGFITLKPNSKCQVNSKINNYCRKYLE